MSAKPRPYQLNPETDRELIRYLRQAQAANEPAEVEVAGDRYRIVPVDDIQTTDNPAVSYDPEKALAAIKAGAGAFKGLDVEAFLAEIMEEREQDTPDHSF